MSHYVITLVHGTFARGAKWTLKGSRLRDHLVRELGKDGSTVSFSHPEWSGNNSHEDRLEGSNKLQHCLSQQLRRDPDARHYVIAHSHGGNVAIRAIRTSPELSNGMAGVITIATPFLLLTRESGRIIFFSKFISTFRQKLFSMLGSFFKTAAAAIFMPLILVGAAFSAGKTWWTRLAFGAGVLGIYAGMIALGFWMLPWLQKTFPWMFGGPVFFWLATGGLVVLIGVATLYVYSDAQRESFRALARGLVRLRRELFQRFAYVQPRAGFGPQMRVLVLSSAFDEAQAALSGAWWIHLWSKVWALSITVLALAVAGASLIALAYGCVYAYQALGVHPMLRNFAEQAMALACILGAILLTLVLSLIAALITAVTSRATPGLGFSSSCANLLLSVQAQRRPGHFLDHDYRRFGVWELLRHSRGALFHSRVYSSPCALSQIVDWMLDRQSVSRPDSSRQPEAPIAVAT